MSDCELLHILLDDLDPIIIALVVAGPGAVLVASAQADQRSRNDLPKSCYAITSLAATHTSLGRVAAIIRGHLPSKIVYTRVRDIAWDEEDP